MKHKATALLLIALLLLGIVGCGQESDLTAPVNFYYPRSTLIYEGGSSILIAEPRESAGLDLSALLEGYFSGPVTGNCRSPFPAGVCLRSWEKTGDTLVLVLSEEFGSLSGLERNIACAAISRTCMELTDASTVQIVIDAELPENKKTISLTYDQILLIDDGENIAETISPT